MLLLPVIALAVYMEGQHYDPAVISFTPTDSGGSAGPSLFPREAAGLSRVGQVRTYTKDNLYEYINGHAEYFISAGFRGLEVGEYGTVTGESGGPAVVVDVYDMGNDLQAFGVFADEVGGQPSLAGVGAMAAETPQGISFIKGKYFVKVATFLQDAPLEGVARAIDQGMGPESASFSLFSRFPDLGEIVGTRFVKEAYRGLDFISNVVEREYRRESKPVQVFLVAGTADKTEELRASFLRYFGDAGVDYDESTVDGVTTYRVKDPYEGDWVLIPFPSVIYGVFGSADEGVVKQVVAKGRQGDKGP